MTDTLTLDPAPLVWFESTVTLDAATVPDDVGAWTMWACERNGDQVAQVTGPIGKLNTLTLNEKGSVSFEVPKFRAAGPADPEDVLIPNPVLDELLPWEREVQIYRGGDLKFVGPILSRSRKSGGSMVEFDAVDVRAYTEKRLYEAEPWRKEWVQNFRFDDGFDRWFISDPSITLDPTHDTGTQSMSIPSNVYIAQTVPIPLPVAVQAVIDAVVWVPAGADPSMGLIADVPGVAAGDSHQTAPITADTPREQWTTLRIVANIKGRPAGREVQLYVYGTDDGAGAELLVDRVSLKLLPPAIISEQLQKLEEVPKQVFLAELISSTSDQLNFSTDTDATMSIPFDGYSGRYVDEVMARFTDTGTLDVDVVCTPRTRTWTSWTRQGRDIDPDEVTLRFTGGPGAVPARGNLASYDDSFDGSTARSDMETIGEGGYRGRFFDLDAYGGLRLEDSQVAPTGTPLTDLDRLSEEAIRASVGGSSTLEVTTSDPLLIDVLKKGDRVAVLIDDGPTQYDAVFRIVDGDIDPPTNSMRLVLVAEPV